MHSMDLRNRTALVTGANRGIGRAIAEALAAEPLELLLAGVRRPGEFEPLVPPPGGAREVRAVRMDLSSRDSIEESCAGLGADLTRIDVLVNNAGLMTGGLLEEQDIDEVYAMFQVNLVAVAHLTARVLPGMVGRSAGLIVNNASISGYAAFPAASTYAAAKAGVVSFSESLRRELRPAGVQVMHLITPGVRTEMLQATEELYGRHMDTSDWDSVEPSEWAGKVVRAMKAGDHVVGPGGRLALAKLASRGPAVLLDAISERMFSRETRR
jgi:short-subunit dehydrogenase